MKKNNISLILIIFIILTVFIKSSYINDIVVNISITFIKNIFPSLFIMFILSSILIKLGFPEIITNIISKIFKKNINKYSLFVFIISMIAGSPTNAKIINELLDEEKISIESANKILKYTFFMNPLFIINTIGTLINDKTISIIVLVANILGNIILSLFYRDKTIYKEDINYKKNNTFVLFNIISDAIKSILNIYGIICFFTVINFVINTFLGTNTFIINSILEVTSGVVAIIDHSMNIVFKSFLLSFFTSFGGLSIHAQIINTLEDKKINYKSFLLSRVLHALISSVINIILTIIYIG